MFNGLRETDGYRGYERTDCAQFARRKKLWNVAGYPRFDGRRWGILRQYILVRDGYRCQVPECPFCENALLSKDMVQVDHVISWLHNGPRSIAYRYGTPRKNADGTYQMRTVGISGRSKGLAVPAIEIPGGRERLIATYGATHAARILGDGYLAEYDPWNLMTVCRQWNESHLDKAKPNEPALVALAVSLQNAHNARNPWQWDNGRPTVETSHMDVPTPAATMESFCLGTAIARKPASLVPALWPLQRFNRMALYPVA